MDDLYIIFDFLGVNSNMLIGLIFGIVVIIILDVIIINLIEKYKKKLFTKSTISNKKVSQKDFD